MTTINRSGIHYAWIVLAVTFACLFVGSALRSVPGIIMLSLEQEFQWSRETISGAVAVNLFLFGLAGPFLGRLMDMHGVNHHHPDDCHGDSGGRRQCPDATTLAIVPALGCRHRCRFGWDFHDHGFCGR
ncbi:MAG: hypothetical protein ABL933_11735 [Methyloglobulus sp.]